MKTKEFQNKVLILSDRIYPMVVRLLGNTENADDAVQEIMIKLWDKRKQLGKHLNINGYVFLTARNYCLDLLKKQNPEQTDSSVHLHLVDPDSGHEALEWEELNSLFKKILNQLPEKQRGVITMRDIDGYSFNEIATVLDLKVEYIRVLLSRGRKQIGVELNKVYCYEKK